MSSNLGSYVGRDYARGLFFFFSLFLGGGCANQDALEGNRMRSNEMHACGGGGGEVVEIS